MPFGGTDVAGAATTAQASAQAYAGSPWTPAQHSLLAWTFDPNEASSTVILTTAGTLYVSLLHVPVAIPTATNLILAATVAGGTLTSGRCFATLHNAAGTLIGASADQHTAWQTAGVYTMAMASGPFALPAGDYYIGAFASGTTLPTFACGNKQIDGTFANVGFTGNYRFASANTGLTTTPPPSLTTLTATALPIWGAIS